MIFQKWLRASIFLILVGCGTSDNGSSSDPPLTPPPPGQWTLESAAFPPTPRILHDMVYDEVHAVVVLYGGIDASGLLNDIWIYDPLTAIWQEQFSDSPPAFNNCEPTPFDHAMVYDTGKQRILYFGIPDALCSSAEMWAYDVDSNTWSNVTPNPSPSPRQSSAMAYNPDTAKVIMFGGETQGGLVNDTWIFDTLDDSWSQANPVSAPSPRLGHAIVYDSTNKEMVLFGGEIEVDPLTRNNETWVYEEATNTWTELLPSAPPVERSKHAMVYDPINGRIVMFGGFAPGSSIPNGETWTFDSTIREWLQVFPQGTPPVSRFLHAMAFDHDRQKTLLFGGTSQGCGLDPGCSADPSFYLDDTWSYINN